LKHEGAEDTKEGGRTTKRGRDSDKVGVPARRVVVKRQAGWVIGWGDRAGDSPAPWDSLTLWRGQPGSVAPGIEIATPGRGTWYGLG